MITPLRKHGDSDSLNLTGNLKRSLSTAGVISTPRTESSGPVIPTLSNAGEIYQPRTES